MGRTHNALVHGQHMGSCWPWGLKELLSSWAVILAWKDNSYQIMVKQTWDWIDIFQKMKWACYFKEKNNTKLTVLVAILIVATETWVFRQNFKFWKTCIHHHKLDSFTIFKDFSDGISGYVCDFFFFWHFMMKCAIIWKSYMTYWANIFPMCSERVMLEKIHSKCKTHQWFNATQDKMFTDGIPDSMLQITLRNTTYTLV